VITRVLRAMHVKTRVINVGAYCCGTTETEGASVMEQRRRRHAWDHQLVLQPHFVLVRHPATRHRVWPSGRVAGGRPYVTR
jgi:hypothetical protein